MYTDWPQWNIYSTYVYLILTSGSCCGLALQEATGNETLVINADNGRIGERTTKSSHSTNLFKYIQYKSIHIHYSAADITKSNVTKNPVGKAGERRKELVHSNRDSIAFGHQRV